MPLTWLSKLSSQFRDSGRGVSLVLSTLHYLLAPRSCHEDEAKRESIFNVISLTLTLVAGTMFLTTLYLNLVEKNRNGISLSAVTLIWISFAALFILGKTKYRKLARQCLLLLFTVPCLYALNRWGLLLVTPLLGLTLVIVMATILHNSRTALVYTGTIIVCLGLLNWAQTLGTITPDQSWLQTPIHHTYWVELSVMFVALLTVTWLAEKEIISGQTRARYAEAELRHERDQLEIRLQERTAQLIKIHTEQTSTLLKLAHYGQEFAGYFHDLINPITAASLTLEEVTHQQTKNAPAQLKKAENAMNKAVKFIQSVQKQLQKESEPVNLNINSAINQAVEIVQRKLQTRNITLHTSITGLPEFYVDPIKLFQIISNLLNNAADACNQTQPNQEKQIWLSTKTDLESLHLIVRDTGPGIPAEILPRIFEPLTTTKQNSDSLGLGLCIVHHIVTQEYGGLIEITKTGSQGTTFSVYLPKTRSLPI